MSDCQRVRHTLVGADGKTHECEIVTQLRRELREQKRLNIKLAERILAAHDVLANLAEKRSAPPRATP